MTLPLTVDPRDAAHRTAGGATFLLDVREPDEYAAARVSSAVLIPLADVAARLSEIPKDRDVIVMCRSGRRSGEAQKLLMQHGYTRVANLEGGILAWEDAGLDVER